MIAMTTFARRMPVFGKITTTLLMLLVTGAMFLWVPRQQGLGNTGRIIIMHVPTAWLSTLAFGIAAIYSVLYLRRRRPGDDDRALAAVEQGLLFSILATATGSVFAKVVWGSFWNWDPRETSILVLLLIYGAYFALRSAIDDPERRQTLAAVYAVLAFATAPLLTFVVPRLAETTLHPNCAFLEGSTCDGVVLREGQVNGLGDTRVQLLEIQRSGDEVTAVVDVSSVGFAERTTMQPSFNTATNEQIAMPTFPNSRFMMVVQEVRPDGTLLLNIRAPGNESQLGNVATRTTFFASLLGFTFLFWWVYRLRVDTLTLRRRLLTERWT
ncbi:MAG: Cytochrome c-type biogenesis protein CcmC, putative heme lyase for CcmE [uncultured Chloroflexia bacterium]|uniref:Heme exporter protein C n=1 Tax=uncultured Chloroflexia bacterium TaxID=1672391 RepID=A0A6J4IKS0_9CHLR|nr:MAG: Cytochrome c-type biogenesis protein CcmC, putative heme lyase for CcmE [uncultured Chloroflexia bacterium]